MTWFQGLMIVVVTFFSIVKQAILSPWRGWK